MNPIVVFDTDCVLCAGLVRFILEHERDQNLRFVGAWSEVGRDLAARHGFSQDDLNDTFLVIEDGRALVRSQAGIAIMQRLRAPWRWLTLLAIVPRPLRDAVYTFVARRRYRWFGHRNNCTSVPPEQMHRFLGLQAAASGAAPER